MQQYMSGLMPMSAPQNNGPGDMLAQGIKMFMGQRQQAAQDAKTRAMINALRPPSPILGGGSAPMGGMFGMSPDQAMPMSALSPTGY